jgi:hypothetical protein
LFQRFTCLVLFAAVATTNGCTSQSDDKGSNSAAVLRKALTSGEGAREGEARIANCMKRLGFVYFPQVTKPHTAFQSSFEVDLATLGSQGYGIANQIEAINPDQRNEKYFASLSSGERLSYGLAIDGSIDGRMQGCRQNAQGGKEQIERGYALGRELERLNALFWSSSEVRRMSAAWSSCMAAEGYPGLDTPRSVDTAILRPQRQQLAQRISAVGGGLILSKEQMEQLKPAILSIELEVGRVDAHCAKPFFSQIAKIRAGQEHEFNARLSGEIRDFIATSQRRR